MITIRDKCKLLKLKDLNKSDLITGLLNPSLAAFIFSAPTSDYVHSDFLCLYLCSELLRSSDEMDILFHLHTSSSQRLSDPPH